MGNFIAFLFYLLGMFVTFCGILIYIYFKPSEKEEYGDEYDVIVIMWPITIIAGIAKFMYFLFEGITQAIGKVIVYVAKKGESRQTKKRLTRNINESGFYESENSK